MARTGYVYFDESTTRWTARVAFTDSTGKKRNVRRVADSESKAEKLLRKLLNDLETKGEKTIDAEKMTFSELAEQYKSFKVKPPEYRNDVSFRWARYCWRIPKCPTNLWSLKK